MDARQDANGRSTLLGVSSVDGVTPIPLKVNPITGRVLIEFTGTALGIQPVGTPVVVGQIPVFSATDGYTVGGLAGSGYIKLASGVASVLSAIVASDITQSASYRFVTDTEKTTWNGKQDALGFTPEDSANKGVANGYASLNGTGKVPSAQLPSFVDDVLEYADLAGFPGTGETGKIYVALDTNKTYRWSGSAYVEISPSPGSTDSVTEGATNLYFTTARVLGTLLSGLSTATATVITASDSILSALGKLQAQVSLRALLTANTFTGDQTINGSNKLNVSSGGGLTPDAINIGGGGIFIGQNNGDAVIRSGFANKIFRLRNSSSVDMFTVALDTGDVASNGLGHFGVGNTQNGHVLNANGSDHVYFGWLVNLVRKAWIGFGSANATSFDITNEQTNGDINLITNGTGKAKINGVTVEDVAKTALSTVNSQTGTTYTFALTDSYNLVTFDNASAITATVPPNSSVAFPIGTQIDVAQLGAGKLTLAQGAGVTINSKGGNKAMSAQYVGGTLKKIGTDTWILFGDLIA